jgi:GTP-binding protein Era
MTENPNFKSGFVTLVGRPNVGKSTLVNALLNQKVAAVSPRPQTTRRRQLGILTLPDAQIVFMDTPGMHKPHYKLGDLMNEAAEETLMDADVIVFMVDAALPPDEEDRLAAEKLAALRGSPPQILAINKIDLVPPEALPAREQLYRDLAPQALPISLSAVTNQNTQQLLDAILERLPIHPPFYDEEQITDLYEREIAADLIREAALIHLREEIPHALAVRIDEFAERTTDQAYIAATLFVERDSQKGIVIGQRGEMLKKIGSTARKEIETMSGRKVFLELRVKVAKNWRNDANALRQFGFSRPDPGEKGK